jgi:hypothetical protein
MLEKHLDWRGEKFNNFAMTPHVRQNFILALFFAGLERYEESTLIST